MSEIGRIAAMTHCGHGKETGEHCGACEKVFAAEDRLRSALSAAEARASRAEAERDEARRALRLCVDELEARSLGTEPGNAPGHGHEQPGVWNDDNGAKAGTRCEWCAAWPRIRALAFSEESR